MRKLIASEFVTLDGVMEAPGGELTHPHTGWVGDYFGDGIGAYKQQEVFDADLLLLGRVTYESFAGAWPSYEGEMAVRMNGMAKLVVSSTLSDPEWSNTGLLRGDPVEGIRELKKGEGGPILLNGSARLLHTLLDGDLVDELRLMVFPVTIGAGLRVFSDTIRKRPWRAGESQSFDGGVRVDVYHPA